MGRTACRTRDLHHWRNCRAHTMKGMKGMKEKTPPIPKVPLHAEPPELEIKEQIVQSKFLDVLAQFQKIEIKLPKGVLIPALTGDPGAEIPGAEAEPVYDLKARGRIQGNIIPGFNKDHQQFLF